MKLAALLAVTLLAGCHRASHDMIDQPRLNPATTSPLFPDRNATREPPPGSVAFARGDAAAVSGGRQGRVEDDSIRPTVDADLLKRGQERYTIYCLPCHGATGTGDGEVVRRGFPAPPAMSAEPLRRAGDAHLHEVILHGWGVMYPFADRVTPADAWAIVGYLRVLQRTPSVAVAASGATR